MSQPAPSPPTARARFRDLVVALLSARLPELQGRIFRARVWPTDSEDTTPCLLVYGYDEVKTLRTVSNAPESHFTVVCTMAVHGRANGLAREPQVVEARLEALAGAIEEALLPAPELLLADTGLERVSEVRTTMKVDMAGDRCAGEVMMAFALQWTEIVPLALPSIDCDEDETSFAVTVLPPFPA